MGKLRGSTEDPIPPDVGRDILKARSLLGLTRDDLSLLTRPPVGKNPSLAREYGVSPETVKNVENGNSKRPATIRRLADVLNRELEQRRIEFRVFSEPKLKESTFQSWLTLPHDEWDARWHGPGALLNAEFRVVPFHGRRRETEVRGLLAWCNSDADVGIRVWRGGGGSGKTRLALELCDRLESGKCGEWTAGILEPKLVPKAGDIWDVQPAFRQSVLVVVDYAGAKEKATVLQKLLASLPTRKKDRTRMLLIDRDDLWLGRVREDKAARNILDANRVQGASFSLDASPLASSEEERAQSFAHAARAFCAKLGLPEAVPKTPRLSGQLYDRV